MTEDRFEQTLRELVRDMGPPPEPPREAMWMAISAERARARLEERRFRGSTLPLLIRWVPAFAVVLATGIALGRWSTAPETGAPLTESAAAAPGTVAESGERPDNAISDGYALATLNTLVSAEALLIGFPEDARAGRSADVSRWASELLTDTRLLADSPAGEDPELARLLADLELLLAQIATLRESPGTNDVELIEDGIDHNDVLMRLRAATGNGIAAGL